MNKEPQEDDLFENRILQITYRFTNGRWVDLRDFRQSEQIPSPNETSEAQDEQK